MAALDLAIRLDDPERTYTLGETVTGTLRLSVHDDVELRRLLVGPSFVVEGTAASAVGGQPELTDVMPGGGHLRAGEPRDVDFEFELPLEPPPYDGENFRIRWQVVARADIPMASDPEAEPVPLVTRLGEASREGPYTGHAMGGSAPDLDIQERAENVGRGLRRGCGKKLLLMLSLPVAVVGVIMLGVFLPAVTDDPFNGVGVAIGAALLLPSFLLWRRIRSTSESAQVGDVGIELDPQMARPGDTIHCRVVLVPARDMTVETVRVSLVAEEHYAVLRSTRAGEMEVGSSTRMDAKALHTDRRVLGEGVEVRAETPAVWEERFQLADGVPYSVRTSSAELRWVMRGYVKVKGAEAVVKDTPVIVRP